jgi:hypothetical protein
MTARTTWVKIKKLPAGGCSIQLSRSDKDCKRPRFEVLQEFVNELLDYRDFARNGEEVGGTK